MAGTKEEMLMMAKRGMWLGCMFSFAQTTGNCLTMPFAQAFRDDLGCDALCVGSQQSARSAIGLVGMVAIGRLSDRFGRTPMLGIGLAGSAASLCIGIAMPSLLGMWLALVPYSLLNQNFSVMKALFTDYYPGSDATSDRSGAIGKLGMFLGLSMMVGSGGASSIVSDYNGAQVLGLIAHIVALPFLLMLPVPLGTAAAASSTIGKQTMFDHLRTLASLPVLRSRGAQLLVFLRAGMALAFWLYYAIWTPSLKQRFDFGAADHGKFMAFIGAVYALAQGVIAKPLIRICTRNRDGRADTSALLCACMVVLALARIYALLCSTRQEATASFALIVVALGVANALLASAVGAIAGGTEAGGLYGFLEACEAVVGMAGPLLGGLLARLEEESGYPHLVLGVVVAVYGMNAAAVALFYHESVVPADGADGAGNSHANGHANGHTKARSLGHGLGARTGRLSLTGPGVGIALSLFALWSFRTGELQSVALPIFATAQLALIPFLVREFV